MKKILKSSAKIRFQDCDPFNHLNNSKYLDYFMNAREDQVLQYYHLDVYKNFIVSKNNWVVASNQIAYLKPVFLMEDIVIESQIFNCTESTLHVEMTMWNAGQSQLKAIYWVKFVYFDIKNLKRTNHSKELMELFLKVETSIEQHNFEDRVQFLKNNTISNAL
ncbi:thioesterase family protein [uncultured Kordia sp.]|uniref:acyl-CoA thioesterase n=1 Tax=uncultured Kordia sp. TaxID=507699 RepID=UPI002605ECB1|nr:acyl-CoA thioesterase [uncultured Kordia sp.]